jgi:hypothetical protein
VVGYTSVVLLEFFMPQKRNVLVQVHVRDEPKDEVHTHTLLPFEVAILKGLQGIPFPGVQIGVLVKEARKFDQGVGINNAYTLIKKLMIQNLVVAKGRYVSMCPEKPSLSLRLFQHYSTPVDSLLEVVNESQNA